METLSWSGRRGRRHARRASQGNTRNGGWFGGAQSAPELPLDTRVLTADDFATLTEALARNGFQGSHKLLPQPRGERPLCQRGTEQRHPTSSRSRWWLS